MKWANQSQNMVSQWIGGMKVGLLHLGHMTKMAATTSDHEVPGFNPLEAEFIL